MPAGGNAHAAGNGAHADGVTPAFYALAREFAVRVAAANQSALRELFDKEPELYRLAFELYRSLGRLLDREAVRDAFLKALSGHVLVTVDAEVVGQLGRPVHDEYWRMAEQPHYWPPGNELMAFDAVVARWRQDRARMFEDAAFFLSGWKKALRIVPP